MGARHPDRLGGLVYLDAAEDPTLTMADYELPPVDRANLPAQVGKPTPVTFPEAEQRLLKEHPIDPAIRKALVDDNKVRPDYARIRVPVLEIYRSFTMEQALEDYPPQNDAQHAACSSRMKRTCCARCVRSRPRSSDGTSRTSTCARRSGTRS